MIETILLLAALFIVFYSLFHLIISIVSGKAGLRDQFWFWVIICLPVAGSLLYFSYVNRPRNFSWHNRFFTKAGIKQKAL